MKFSSPVGKRHTRIEIIPLIDIMFFLLASFMMVSLQMSKTQNKKVALPMAWQAKSDFNASMINIGVDKDGGLWLEKKPITRDALDAELKSRYHTVTNLPVYVSADAETPHGELLPLYDLIRLIGVQKVSFMVASPTGGASPDAANP